MNINESDAKWVWVFSASSRFPCGIFETREQAEAWINENKIDGCLTRYPLGEGIYDHAVKMSYFTPKRDYQFEPEFKSNFSCASLEHHHYEFETEAFAGK